MEKLTTKNDLLTKLRAYREVPDDESVQYKQKIKHALMLNPSLLYALNESKLESELFDNDGNINWEWNEEKQEYEPLGEWDRYFGESANIRPYLYIPETQTNVRNYLCYQVSFNSTPKYQDTLKYTEVTFTIFVHGDNGIDKLTGIPRHDLIASIIRERFNWSNIFGMQTHLTSSVEKVTDTNYLTRTLIFELTDTNGLVTTSNGKTGISNYHFRR